MNGLVSPVVHGKTFRSSGFLLATAILMATPALAGVNQWTSGGPSGAEVLCLAIDPMNPEVVYAGTARRGVFKSLNGGGSWSGELDGIDVTSLAIDPVTPSRVYAVTSLGVFKSTDGAVSWTATSLAASLSSLLIPHETPSTILGADWDGAYYPRPSSVYKSTDYGATWSQSNAGIALGTVVIDAANPPTLYAPSGGPLLGMDGGVYKSVDFGLIWRLTSRDLTQNPPSAVVIDASNFSTLYAVTYRGLYKSVDAGSSWRLKSSALTTEDVTTLVIDRQNPSTLYAATNGRGVLRSADGGVSWNAFNTGLTNLAVSALAINPSGTFLHAGTLGGGVFDYAIVPTVAASFYTLAPCRVVDTRNPSGPYGGPSLQAGADRNFVFAGQCGVPSTATAIVLNVTAILPTDGPGHLTLFPLGATQPLASTINYNTGKIRANNAIIPLGALADITVNCGQRTGTVDMVIDVNGYFQ